MRMLSNYQMCLIGDWLEEGNKALCQGKAKVGLLDKEIADF